MGREIYEGKEIDYDKEIENTEVYSKADEIIWRFWNQIDEGLLATEVEHDGLQSAFRVWQHATRVRLSKLITLDSCEHAPLNPIRRSKSVEDGYIKEKWDITTEPGVHMPFYLLKPIDSDDQTRHESLTQQISQKHPAVIIPHGHYPGGKESVVDNREGDGFATQFAKKGYYVFCPDSRGAGERIRYSDKKNGNQNSHKTLFNAYIGAGRVLIGLMTWDLMRLVDFVESIPEVDKDRIGCAGMSGGGQQTLYLAAMDERIKVASTSGYFYGFKEALLEQPGNCSCNFVPGIWGKIDMADMAGLIAPRPLHIESGKLDGLSGRRGIENVYEQVEIAKEYYKLAGEDSHDREGEQGCLGLEHHVHELGHVWVGDGLLDFFDRYL